MTKTCTTEALLTGTQIPLDVFSYHYYNGVSERIAGVMPAAHWPGHLAHSDEYLAVAPDCTSAHAALRDKFVLGGQMWVTESGDAGGAEILGPPRIWMFCARSTNWAAMAPSPTGIIFHNTLASSDYGFLEHGTFLPRPNYFAVLLWNRLMGTAVYDCGHLNRENAHVYCHSRRDGTCGVVYLIINNSLTDTISVTIPKDALR